MAADDLNKPLGDLHHPRGMGDRPRGRRTGFVILAFCVGLASVGVAATMVMTGPRGGEPFAIAGIAPPRKAADKPAEPQPTAPITAAASPAAVAGDPSGGNGVLENGVRIFRSARTTEPSRGGPLVIKVPDALGQSEIAPVDRRLIEVTRYGPLPKIGADGARPSDVYARPPVFGGLIRPGAARIAIIVDELDPDRAATMDAAASLPAAVSMAFPATAEHLDNGVNRVKAAGHEVLLQLSMELGDESDRSAAHRLLVNAPQNKMMEDLHWLLGRMTGYVGVMNAPGSQFTADKAAMTLMLKDVGERGLLYADDGSSRRTLGPSLAPTLGTPVARADAVLQASADPAALKAALGALEAIARARGAAVAVVAAAPATCGAIADFIATFDAKGLALVPVSSLTNASVPIVATTP